MKFALFLFITLFILQVYANTEKIILQARSASLNRRCDAAAVSAPSLIPPYTKLQQSIVPSSTTTGNNTQLFHLDNLDDGSNYEVRISYPAITPGDFTMHAVNGCIGADGRLSYTLSISAVYTGVSQKRGMDTAPIVYDLVLETLYFGFIFYECYKIVLAIVGALILGQFIVIPRVKELITQKAKTL